MEEVNSKESNRALIVSGIVIFLVVAGLFTNGFWLFGPNGLLTGGVVSGATLSIGNSPVLGNDNAPVTIYEFSDFSCPFCAAAAGENQLAIENLKSRDSSWEAPLPSVIENYVKTGKAKIVFKYYPGHGLGENAQLVGLALNEQRLFWQFADKAFANQEKIGDLRYFALAQVYIRQEGRGACNCGECDERERRVGKIK